MGRISCAFPGRRSCDPTGRSRNRSSAERADANLTGAAKIDRGALSWALFEWARNPYIILCVIYVLGPYIATEVIGDPVRGQAIISSWHRTAGFFVALTAPLLGAAADRMGHRKPLLGLAVAIMAPAIFVQYWAMPEGGLPIWAVGWAIIAAGVAFNWSEVMHNSMLTRATDHALVPNVSGLGLALGNAASVLLLVFVLWCIALPGTLDWPQLPDAPIFGLDPAKHEPSRIVAPLSAIWLVLFSIPLFLFTRDRDATGEKFGDALRHGISSVVGTVRKLRNHGNVALFLLARMLYNDAKTAILIFGGVYAAGVMGWGLVERIAYGVILSVFAVIGGFAGGWLDHAVGSKRAVAIEIAVTFLCMVAMVSITAGRILFFIPVEPGEAVWNGIFQTVPELAYLGFSIVIAISITAAYASSRTLTARISPPGMEGEIFGLYALSGSATVWLGPALVEYFTLSFNSQRVGFASIGILLLAGLALLVFVKPPAK